MGPWRLGALWDLVPVNEFFLLPLMSPMLWKRGPISLDIPLMKFKSGTFIWLIYSCAFIVLWKMTALIMLCCRVSLPVYWLMNAQ